MKKRKKTDLKLTVSWFRFKKTLNKYGLYPKKIPSSKIEFFLWCIELGLRMRRNKKEYIIPSFMDGGHIRGEQGPEPVLSLKGGYLGTLKNPIYVSKSN